MTCSVGCVKADGCTDGTSEGCNTCAPGWEVIPEAEKGCRDIDECVADPAVCGEGYTCRNTRGAHECNCLTPNFEQDGKCVAPAAPEAAATDPKDEL